MTPEEIDTAIKNLQALGDYEVDDEEIDRDKKRVQK
jgi:hypothetical protein